MNKIVAGYKGDVIKINGVCYQFTGFTEQPADAVEDGPAYANCEECEQESSAALSSAPLEYAKVNCGSAPADTRPRMAVTMNWTGGPTTRVFLGATWSKGETKVICPNNYSAFGLERWTHIIGGERVRVKNETSLGVIVTVQLTSTTVAQLGVADGNQVNTNVQPGYSPTTGALFLASAVQPVQFGSFTTTGGITLSWLPISGAGQPWDNWKIGPGNGMPYLY